MKGRTNQHGSISFWVIIACVVIVSAGISFLITSPRHKKRDGGSTVKQYSSTSDNHSDLVQNTSKESQSESNISASNENLIEEQNGMFKHDAEAASYVQDTWLTELDYVKKGDVTIQDSTGQTNTGVEYAHYMYSSCPYSEIIYNLNGNYDTLTALWSITYYDRDTDTRNSFEIYADDNLVYTSPTITGGDLPVDVSVDINGCKLLTIMFKDGTGAAELANLWLSNKTERVENKVDDTDQINLPCWLTDLEYFFNDGVEVRANEVGTANTGDQYSHYMFGVGGRKIVYYLDGKYEKLTGMWMVCYMNRDTTNRGKFTIYADNTHIYTSPLLTAGDEPVNFEVDLQNCKKLQIVFNCGGGECELGNIRLFPGETPTTNNWTIETTKGNGEWLTSLSYLKNDGVAVNDEEEKTTNTGKKYSHYLRGIEATEIIYYLEGKYSSISGLWTISQERRDTTETSAFEVYADETLVYTSPNIKGGDIPVTFEVGISNCQKLRIVFTKGIGDGEIGNIVLGHNVIEPETNNVETQAEVEEKTEEMITTTEDSKSVDISTENSSAVSITIEESKNEDSPFEGKYWVIFTEGTRNDRVEATSVDAISLKLHVIWDGALYLSKTNGGTKYVQYYLDENGEWCKMGKYFRFSDNASNVIASNLDVYDGNGNLLLKGCAYSDIDWALINRYR